MSFLMNLIPQRFNRPPSLVTLLIEDNCYQSSLFYACDQYLCSKYVFGSDGDCECGWDSDCECDSDCDSDHIMITTLKILENHDKDTPHLSLVPGQQIREVFRGIEFVWRYTERGQNRCFELTVEARQRKALDSYLNFVRKYCDDMKHKRRPHIYTLDHHYSYGRSLEWRHWSSDFKHPMTFRFLAMDPDLKKSIVYDLDLFMSTSELHKRFYFLYGPRGAGKSCLIASIANYLKFDLYRLCVDEVEDESTLRSLIEDVPRRSILVIEDAQHSENCSMDPDKDGDGCPHETISKISLARLLNLVDESWSSRSKGKKILIFSSHQRKKLERSALLQSGHIDMHINMSYLTVPVFRILASIYLGISIDEHPLFGEIVRLMQTVDVTTAEVVANVIHRYDAETALQGLIELLNDKKSQAEINKSSVSDYQFRLERRRPKPRKSTRKRT